MKLKAEGLTQHYTWEPGHITQILFDTTEDEWTIRGNSASLAEIDRVGLDMVTAQPEQQGI